MVKWKFTNSNLYYAIYNNDPTYWEMPIKTCTKMSSAETNGKQICNISGIFSDILKSHDRYIIELSIPDHASIVKTGAHQYKTTAFRINKGFKPSAEIIYQLISDGADINVSLKHAFQLAVLFHMDKLLIDIVKTGIQSDLGNLPYLLRSYKNNSKIHYSKISIGIYASCLTGDLHSLSLLIKSNKVLIHESVIPILCINGNIKILTKILEYSPKVTKLDEFVQLAMDNSNVDVAVLLMNYMKVDQDKIFEITSYQKVNINDMSVIDLMCEDISNRIDNYNFSV